MMIRTKYFIGVPCIDKPDYYYLITDITKPIVDEHGNVRTLEGVTEVEEDALTFYNLDAALEWCDSNLEDYASELVEPSIGTFDWDNAVIIKNDNTIIPL